MANEITVTANLAANTGSGVLGFSESETSSNVNFTLTASTGVYVKGSMATSTSPAAIPMGAIVTAKWGYFKNPDTTNSVTIRNGSGGAEVVSLPPGGVAVLPLKSSIAPYVTASASTPQVEYFILGLNA